MWVHLISDIFIVPTPIFAKKKLLFPIELLTETAFTLMLCFNFKKIVISIVELSCLFKNTSL